MTTCRITVLGGDMRSVKLSDLFTKDGHSVHTFALDTGNISQRCSELSEAFAISDIIVGPIPFCVENGLYLNTPFHPEKIETSKIAELAHIYSQKLLVGGNIPYLIQKELPHCEDLLKRDDLAVLNSVPTAEGALQIAMEELPYTLRGTKALVCGMGRVGSTLARLLRNVGADVTVAARSSRDFAICEAEGIKHCSYSDIYDVLSEAILIYNTVPAKIFGRELLDATRQDALIIDLASMPGGIDFEYADAHHIRTIHALSLPGKVAPMGAAMIIQKVIYNILCEKKFLI